MNSRKARMALGIIHKLLSNNLANHCKLLQNVIQALLRAELKTALFILIVVGLSTTAIGRPSFEENPISPTADSTNYSRFKVTPNLTQGSNFGYSVAISGDTLVVGAPQVNIAGKRAAGAAYVFIRSGAVWIEQQTLIASDGAALDQFGTFVAISGDTIVVGSPSDTTIAGDDAGSAYVFVRSGAAWFEQRKLTASDGARGTRFGSSISINGDTMLIGAPNANVAGRNYAGAAYVFMRSGGAWPEHEQQKLISGDMTTSDQFGTSVAINGDTILIGAPNADLTSKTGAGAAYVFVRSGAQWRGQQKLTASDSRGGQKFGGSVAIEGNTAVIGADHANSPSKLGTGAAYMFLRSGAQWNEQQKLTARDGTNVADSATPLLLVGMQLSLAPFLVVVKARRMCSCAVRVGGLNMNNKNSRLTRCQAVPALAVRSG